MKTIQLTQGKETIVDDEDHGWLMQWKWYYKKGNSEKYQGYATRTMKNIKMHRVIMNCPDDMLVDHIDGDTLNNKKSNLRIVTYQQSSMNRKVLGVSFNKQRKLYVAAINHMKTRYYLGAYITKEEAVLAYQYAADYYFKEYKRKLLL